MHYFSPFRATFLAHLILLNSIITQPFDHPFYVTSCYHELELLDMCSVANLTTFTFVLPGPMVYSYGNLHQTLI